MVQCPIVLNHPILISITDSKQKISYKSHTVDNGSGNGSATNGTTKEKRPSDMQGSNATELSSHDKYEAKKSILILIGIFSISLTVMFYVYLMFPTLEE